MKLIRFGDKGQEKPGVMINHQRKDCSGYFSDWNREFFNNNGLNNLRELLEKQGENLPDIDSGVRWASCIARPNMILCIGLNYADHAREAGMDLPSEPIVFGKAGNSISGPYDDIRMAKAATKVDYEIELGVVLNQDIFELNSEEEAENAIAGYCLTNDLSERNFQLEKGGQWIKGKSCPGFCPAGPYLLTKDEVYDVTDLSMELKVNGSVRQQGNTNTMIFKPAFIVSYLSQFMMMEAGDLILTGTPPGVAMGMNPPVYLKNNDVILSVIEGLGEQKIRLLSGN
jgi:2-keto-4-pentenoate hydratase/2-oxohepta-3-ene-1,7-dioic acid hydratase in catechol pathway